VTSTTVTLPSGLTDGDYTIIFVTLNASSGNITTPSGWTNILPDTNSANGSTSMAHAIFYRKWQSGDGDVAVSTSNGRVAATPVRVQGADGTTFVNTAADLTQAASGAVTITAPSITPSSTVLVCSFAGRDATNGDVLDPWTNLSAGLTKIAEANGRAASQTNAGHCIAYEVVTADSATGTRQADAAQATTGAFGVSFALNEATGGSSPQTVSPTGLASDDIFGAPALGTEILSSTFDDGTADGWTESIGGAGTTAITGTAAHDGAYGASADVPAATGDKAGFTRSVGPSGSVTIRGWWKVTTEGASSGSNVPFARLFYGNQRLADVYRQNVVAGSNVWMRVTKAIGGSNYYFIPTGYRLEVDAWVYISFTWDLTGVPHLFIDGVEYLNASDAPADWFDAPQIDTAYLGTHESGNQGAWAIDTVDVITVSEPPTVVSPDGIATAEAFGSPSVSAILTTSPSAITSSEAVGAPSISTTLTVSPSGVATAGAFGVPSVTATLTASPLGIATAEALGAPSLSATLTASPAGIAGAGAVGTPALSSTLDVAPSGLASAEAAGSPALSTSLTSSPSGISTAEAHGAPSLDVPIGTEPAGIAGGEALGSPALGGNLNTFPTGIASSEALGSPSVGNPLPVNPASIATSEAFGTPALALGATITPPGIASAEAFGSPLISALLTVAPAGVDSSESFGSPTIYTDLLVTQAGGIVTAAAFGSPTISAGGAAQTLNPTGVPSAGALGAPFMTWDRTVTPASIGSLEAFGQPRLSTVVVTHPTTLPSSYGLGVPTVQLKLTAFPSGIAGQEAFGVPALEHIVLEVGPTGLSTLESFGVPRVTGGSQATPYEMSGALQKSRYSGRQQAPGTTSQTPNRWEGSLD
jgi:hypothetical protein